ncbi:MAG: hypothetical protein N2039_03085 [Gemmataceae bacterium]|nr:hypothetical protein [Gemmataceae bacterium]
MEALRRGGNPFRNYFARNPDDDVCARYHVPELFATERDLLLAVVDLYRQDPSTHSEVIPVLGNKGAGKTHLLHSIKHGPEARWQLLVTPGVYQRDTEFLEYLLFQIIDTLLGGGRQKGIRPLEFVGEELIRGYVHAALTALDPEAKRDLFPATGFGRLTRMIGFGGGSVEQRCQAFLDSLQQRENAIKFSRPLRRCILDAGLTPERIFDLVAAHIERSESHSTAGLMRRAICLGFARAVLLEDEADLANFLTFGFAELEFHVRPTRQDLVLALLKVLTAIFRELKIPVVIAFDQLEDLLLARRSDDAHRIAEAFFAGIVQVMHQIDGLCFLIFAERGLWNRFVPSLDGYIQDRLNNPMHVPGQGTVKTLRLEAPSPELVRRVVEARLRGLLDPGDDVPEIFPFTDEQVFRIARTEPTLRDMLQQFRHLFDHLVYGTEDERVIRPAEARPSMVVKGEARSNRLGNEPPVHVEIPMTGTPPSRLEDPNVSIKSVLVFESEHPPKIPLPDAPIPLNSGTSVPLMPASPPVVPASTAPSSISNPPVDRSSSSSLAEMWDQEWRAARRQLEPEGALTGATRELQSALGTFLQICHEHGVKVGPWRLQHVVPEFAFSEHPTYGVISIAHWACKGGQPWKVGIGLFLGKGGGKPKDLEIKLASWDCEPAVIDHLILLRPDDDLILSGRSKSLWQDAERKGRHTRLEGMTLDRFAALYAFPRWLATITESLPEGQPLPNLADLIQEKCEKLLEQVCMPVQG